MKRFNLSAHKHLIALGYEFGINWRQGAGPRVRAWDEYLSKEDIVYIDKHGGCHCDQYNKQAMEDWG